MSTDLLDLLGWLISIILCMVAGYRMEIWENGRQERRLNHLARIIADLELMGDRVDPALKVEMLQRYREAKTQYLTRLEK